MRWVVGLFVFLLVMVIAVAMRWVTELFIFLLLLVVAMFAAEAAEKRAVRRLMRQCWEARQDGLWIQAHFPDMIMLKTYSDSGRAWVFHLRRRADGSWEEKMTSESFERLCAEHEHSARSPWFIGASDSEKFIKKAMTWQPFDGRFGGIETAFQRFILIKDIAAFPMADRWRSNDRQRAIRERVERGKGIAHENARKVKAISSSGEQND